MKFILGKKIGMTQVWKGEEVVAVTKVKAGPCVITQVKTGEKDSYEGVQLGFETKREKLVKKPQKGHFKKLGSNFRHLREFRLEKLEENLSSGKTIKADTFEVGDKVDVTGVSKGRGFQGVVKRHNFAGAIKTHGTKDQHRMPGSAGAMGVGRIFKGKRSPGRMGGDRVTMKNLEIIEVNPEEDVLLIKGAITGANGGLILLKGEGELKVEDYSNIKEEEKNKNKEKEENKEEADKKETSESEQADKAPQDPNESSEEKVEEKKENK